MNKVAELINNENYIFPVFSNLFLAYIKYVIFFNMAIIFIFSFGYEKKPVTECERTGKIH